MLKYDAWNRLIEVKHNTTLILTNDYDGLDRLIVKDVNAGGTDKDRHYCYDEEWQVLEIRKTETCNPVEHLVWHSFYIDALAVRFCNSNGDTDFSDTNERQFVVPDANYNVTAIVNNSGTVLERYHYTPYGEVTILNGASDSDGSEWTVDTNGSDIANVHLYTGRERDPETGLQLNRRRFYHAQLGRWVTRDPIGYAGGSANLYEHVLGRPVVSRDPSGLDELSDMFNELPFVDPSPFFPGPKPPRSEFVPPEIPPDPALIYCICAQLHNSCPACTQEHCMRTLNLINEVADEIEVDPGYDQCDRWCQAFEIHQKPPEWPKSPDPCFTGITIDLCASKLTYC